MLKGLRHHQLWHIHLFRCAAIFGSTPPTRQAKPPHPIEQDPPPDERRGFPLVPYLGVFLGYIHFFVYFCTINKWKWDARSKILV